MCPRRQKLSRSEVKPPSLLGVEPLSDSRFLIVLCCWSVFYKIESKASRARSGGRQKYTGIQGCTSLLEMGKRLRETALTN